MQIQAKSVLNNRVSGEIYRLNNEAAMIEQLELLRLRQRARQGITTAKRLRKYCPPGPYSPVEQEALAALLDVERAADRLAKAQNELDTPRTSPPRR
jgi:hypothetical protein